MRKKNLALWMLAWMWRLVCQAVKILGRTGSIVVGVLMILFGFLLSLSIVGVFVGIPLILLGAMLIVCALLKGK